MKILLSIKLERFKNLVSSVENNSITDFLIERHSVIDVIEDEYIDFISFLKEYQEHYEFSKSEKDSIRISIIRYVAIAIREGIQFDGINESIW